MRFDFGGNLLGNNIEERGSYIYNLSEFYPDLIPEEKRTEYERLGLDGPLVKNFDVAGSLAGSLAAIYISDNAFESVDPRRLFRITRTSTRDSHCPIRL